MEREGGACVEGSGEGWHFGNKGFDVMSCIIDDQSSDSER